MPLQLYQRLGFLAILLLLRATTVAQPSLPATLAAPRPLQALQQDFDLFQRIYEAANPSIYRYHTRQQLDSAFTTTRRQLKGSTTLLEFYRLLYGITAYTGSLHSDNYLPAAVDSILKASPGYFPYPVQLLAGQLRLNTSAAPLPLGSELVRINGHSVTELRKQLGIFATTDGYNQTGKDYLISTHFARYYYLAYGPCATFRLAYQAPYQADTTQLLVAAVPYATYAQRYEQRHSAALETDVPPYRVALLDSLHTALLMVNTFDLGSSDEPSQRRYARFLDSTFQWLRATPTVRQLIVDVRQNTGGDDPNDLLLFSYLATHRFRENRRAFTNFRQVPYPNYFVEESPGDRAELTQELMEEHGPARRGRHWLKRREHPYWHPNPRAFRGQVYLLISPAVASAGSLFASLVRSQRGPIILGQETMGGYYGHTGHTPVEYELPATKLRIKFSIVDLEQDVHQRRRFPRGRGVLPDYEVTPSLADFLLNKDATLQSILQLIKQRSNL